MYFYSLKRKYPGLSLATMMAILKEPARLCQHGLMMALSKQYPKTQSLVLQLYNSGVRGGEESEEAAVKIFQCINKKFAVFGLITAAIKSGEFISAYEMADIFDHLPKSNLDQVKEVLNEGLVKATNKVSLILS